MLPGIGNYVCLKAEGPGEDLWYSESGNWVEDEAQKKIFAGAQAAVHTPIVGLPKGYRAHLACTTIDTPNNTDGSGWDCCCC